MKLADFQMTMMVLLLLLAIDVERNAEQIQQYDVWTDNKPDQIQQTYLLTRRFAEHYQQYDVWTDHKAEHIQQTYQLTRRFADHYQQPT